MTKPTALSGPTKHSTGRPKITPPVSWFVGPANHLGLVSRRSAADNVKPQHPLPAFTEKQGQYLAFIYYYTKVSGRAPSEADIQGYFGVTPPSVHQMVVTLERKGFITRIPGQGRSITLRLSRQQLPDLE